MERTYIEAVRRLFIYSPKLQFWRILEKNVLWILRHIEKTYAYIVMLWRLLCEVDYVRKTLWEWREKDVVRNEKDVVKKTLWKWRCEKDPVNKTLWKRKKTLVVRKTFRYWRCEKDVVKKTVRKKKKGCEKDVPSVDSVDRLSEFPMFFF